MESAKVSTSRLPAISIVGLGYVGLATAVCFANRGFRVYGVEVDKRKCNLISSGKSPIHEDGVYSGLESAISSGALTCSIDVREAVSKSDITFLTVGTPSKPNGEINLAYVEEAAYEVGRAIRESQRYHIVVVKSTVIPGTTRGVVRKLLEDSSGKSYPNDFGLCFNPEFLREGTAIYDTMNPDAVIIGAEDQKATDRLLDLYKQFYFDQEFPTLVMRISNAEFVKYSINSFRATQLSFLNSLANLCEKIPSADIAEVTKGLSTVTKIDKRYLRAGLGFGGSCLPKDLNALTHLFETNDVPAPILHSAAQVNERQPSRAIEIAKSLLGNLRGKQVSILGLTFKAGTDDIRESVAIKITSLLVREGAKVKVYDPKGMENAMQVLQTSVEFATSAISCIRGADCCIVATEWDEFRQIPASTFKREMAQPNLIDGCRLSDYDAFWESGVSVYEIGRNQTKSSKLEVRPVSGTRS